MSPKAVVRDTFARGQFRNLSEDEKISTPAFEDFPSGQTRIGTGAITIGTPQHAAFEYDVTIIDNKEAQIKRTSKKKETLAISLLDTAFVRATQSGAAKQTPMDSLGSAKFTGPLQGITVREPTYRLVGMDDMSVRGTDTYNTYTEAEAARRSGASGELQVVEVHEVI